MTHIPQRRTSVSALMGAAVYRADGGEYGRVREFAVAPLVDASIVQALVIQPKGTSRPDQRSLLPIASLKFGAADQLQIRDNVQPELMSAHQEFLMLERDLLDQQIIDVHGHKVVRVNDVDFFWETGSAPTDPPQLKIAEVEVGTRGAMRRLLKGLPVKSVEQLTCKIRPTVIPWDFVDLIDRDPARRVRLKIEQDKLARMHPSDLADILEELAPAERDALFSSLDEEVAAETLEEVDAKTQKTMLGALDSERIAGILERMDPGAAADLLSELSDERSEAILGEMNEDERSEVKELLEYAPNSAAGLMTTDYVAVSVGLAVGDAMRALKSFEGDLEAITEIFIIDAQGHLKAVIPLSRLLLASPGDRLSEMQEEHLTSTSLGAPGKKVAELFDKYNLRSLPVLDDHQQLAGIIRPEHVIGWLRGAR